ncbi:hypothetical protein DERP_011125 [Dermatophagoides pteronyssinus]|uniref:Uncharacterized protein n=1 Tax=Dermatophagoides pteronyssinus TaxID=6956 RepID=A0ABQ8J8W8_DERPT|nr:hypothetical protein DERP_011125 [Dermatophagoides pteronyssinus]
MLGQDFLPVFPEHLVHKPFDLNHSLVPGALGVPLIVYDLPDDVIPYANNRASFCSSINDFNIGRHIRTVRI